MVRIGYARVSTVDQNPQLQTDALQNAGCIKIFTDFASGAKCDRPQLKEALNYLRPADTLVVWKLDRLGRNTKHLIETISDLEERKVEFMSLTEGMDTSTPMGRMIFCVLAALSQFERELIRERVMAGLVAAKLAGRKGGRPEALTPARKQAALNLRAAGTSVSEIARILRVGTSTVYRCFSAST
jgi:DNA invertase Pin-like site-specific DNA recombinase